VLDLAGEAGFTIYYWHVMDAGRDSVDLLRKLLNRFGPRLRYILVFNQIRGDDFTILKESGEDVRALSLDARAISMRHLPDAAMNKIDASSSSFWAAQNSGGKENAGLGLMDRQRVKTWLREIYQQLDAAAI